MISLTPCIAPTIPRKCDLDASVPFKDVNDMIDMLNTILSKAQDFPQIPTPRDDCHIYPCQANRATQADGDVSRAGLRMGHIHGRLGDLDG